MIGFIYAVVPFLLFLKSTELKNFRNFRVSTEVNTNWKFCRNQALYVSEFIYQQNPTALQSFLLKLGEIDASSADEEEDDQKLLIDLVKKSNLVDDSLISLLKLNLEMDTFAPKFENIIQFQYQIRLPCDIFLEYLDGRFTCSLKDLEGKDGLGVTKTSPFDYKISQSSDKKNVRLFTIPGAKKFKKFVEKMEILDLNILIQLIPDPKSCPYYASKINLTGYGLEFELKPSDGLEDEEKSKSSEASNSSDGELIDFKSFIKSEAIETLYSHPSMESFYKAVSTSNIIDTKQPEDNTINVDHERFDPRFTINYMELKQMNMDPFRLLDFMNVYVNNDKELATFENSVQFKKVLKSRENHLWNKQEIRYKIDSEAITFLNDLEADKRYSEWPKSFENESSGTDGKYYSRNVATVVIPIDFDQSESADLIENLVQMVTSSYPLRLAVLPIVSSKGARAVLWIQAYYAVRKQHGLKASTAFLRDALKMHKIASKRATKVSSTISELLKQLKLEVNLSNGDEMVLEARKICRRFGMDGSADEIFVNGLPIPRNRDLSSQLMLQYSEDLAVVKASQELIDSDDLYSAILKHFNAKEMRINLSGDLIYDTSPFLSADSIHKLVKLNNYTASSDESKRLSIWLAGEFNKKETFFFFIEALKLIEKLDYARLRAFVTNPMTSMPNRIVLAATAVLAETSDALQSVIQFIENFSDNYYGNDDGRKMDFSSFESESDEYIEKLMNYARDLDSKQIQALMEENEIFYAIFDDLHYDDYFVLALNGVSYSIPVGDCEYYASGLGSIVEMFMFESGERLSKLADFDANLTITYCIYENNFINLVNEHFPQLLSTSPVPWPETKFIDIGDETESIFHVQALFDPFSRQGQKFAAILSYFASTTGMFSFKLGFFADPNDGESVNIYRFVTPESKNIPIPVAEGAEGEKNILFSMTLDLPSAWMVVPESSNCDLSNIQPKLVSHVKASFNLKFLIIEGQVMFEEGEIASGQTIQIYSSSSGLLVDETRVLANYGYYQVKVGPGEYRFRVLNRISETEIEEYEILSGEKVTMKSFGGLFNRIKLSKEEPIKRKFRQSLPKPADLNIFVSPSSGYSDWIMLRVMILSVLKANPKSSIKFWIVQTDQTILGLKELSKKYEFEYELVSYKWPSWLHQQAKKDRIMQGYKVLFLDVILPQYLDKVIVMDSDLMVKPSGDLTQLLNSSAASSGKIFAMVPFCSDKSEMKMYRFWEDGYWRDHLKGNPYHMSSLIVVDLFNLRRKFISDILRAEYHILSEMNSKNLANLDQDLLNNMQELAPIHSLATTWSWSDAWCAESTKSTAKIINFSKNPSKQESKLHQAKRISSLFTDYDKEIKKVMKKHSMVEEERWEL